MEFDKATGNKILHVNEPDTGKGALPEQDIKAGQEEVSKMINKSGKTPSKSVSSGEYEVTDEKGVKFTTDEKGNRVRTSEVKLRRTGN